jgi:preprotein translocase subunit SecA
VDEKAHTVLLSEAGHEHAEDLLARMGLLPEGGSLYEPANILLIHHLYAALRAHACSTATSTMSCRTAKSSSSTNSPAA